MSSIRTLVWRGDFDASFLYRLALPLSAAYDQGLTDVAFLDWGNTGETVPDVLVAQRLMTPEMADQFTSAVARLKVLEYDDDLLALRADSRVFHSLDRRLYLDQWVPAMARALASADLVTVSVAPLAERLRAHTDAPTVVLPNTIHGSLLSLPSPQRADGEQLKVGWGGTGTHDTGWMDHGPGIARGLKAAKARMIMIGSDYSFLLNHPVEFRPGTESLSEYYGLISDLHVMLAPLRDDDFNRSKSPLKALEAAALGIPTVAAAAGPYPDFVIDGETGFLCRTRNDWERALKALAYDEDRRRTMGAAARERARTLVTGEWAARWVETYREALASKHAIAGI
ncbi:glycosyltransferase family protein [Nocardioides sp. Kera G14]|uniref:glycosyltransferase n=1 Tax=Nocardioides sp. Kera G14 TaxID=2884264 RepID=UPI001D129E4E|nr:glycosyltransferase [Nocardioides sp. Kera G14]UDY24081.1 glycosyltransferase [Nocardioides sp. Kera G14]